jgi:hypothetical protein
VTEKKKKQQHVVSSQKPNYNIQMVKVLIILHKKGLTNGLFYDIITVETFI